MLPRMPTPRPVRHRCELHAEVQTGPVRCETRVLELSEAGAFVEDAEALFDLEPGAHVTLFLDLQGAEEPWAANARVQRHGATQANEPRGGIDHLSVSRRGLGVEFQGLDEEELERLRDFIDLLDDR